MGALEYPQRRDIAARLANYVIKENKTVIDAEAARLKIEDTLPWVGRDKAKAPAESAIIRERMSERGGILRVTKNGSLEFVHNTFKEFLAASAFAHDLEAEFLTDNAFRADCANVCRFAAGGGNPEYAKRLASIFTDRQRPNKSAPTLGVAPMGRSVVAVIRDGALRGAR